MPESYFHVRCAKIACQRCGATGYDIAAVVAGAAGPDVLFYHLGLPTLARLGQRLHSERCGPFLTALVRGADTAVLRGYVLGFLSHNAADATVHPWIAAQSGPHAVLEQEMDSLYLLRDKGRAKLRPGDCAVRLRPEKALEIGGLLSRCILEVYGVRVSAAALAGTFDDFYRCKGWLRDSRGRKSRAAIWAEGLFKLTPGTLSGHLITGAAGSGTEAPDALAARAEDLSCELMTAAARWWRGELGPLELSRDLGGRSYLTGEEA